MVLMRLWQRYRYPDGGQATREEVIDFLWAKYRGWCVPRAGFAYLVDQEW